MFVELCLCAGSPLLKLSTRVVIFMHRREHHLVTNTAVLARRLLANSHLVFRGHQSRQVVTRETLSSPESRKTFILYPAPEAMVLGEQFLKDNPGPLTLICPDGHWGQVRKMIRHEKALEGIPFVKLPDGQKSAYRLRRNIIDGRVCTFEAIARALGVIEGQEVQQEMETVFQKMITRLLWMRGKIGRAEVVW